MRVTGTAWPLSHCEGLSEVSGGHGNRLLPHTLPRPPPSVCTEVVSHLRGAFSGGPLVMLPWDHQAKQWHSGCPARGRDLCRSHGGRGGAGPGRPSRALSLCTLARRVSSGAWQPCACVCMRTCMYVYMRVRVCMHTYLCMSMCVLGRALLSVDPDGWALSGPAACPLVLSL